MSQTAPAEATGGYIPKLWERILAALCAVATILVVFAIVLRKQPFAEENQVVLIRIVLSLAISIIGAVVPGFLQVDLSFRGVVVRSGGALALFVVTFFFSPRALPLAISTKQLSQIETNSNKAIIDINRIITTFHSVYVQAIYELPRNEPCVKVLEQALADIGNAHEAKTQGVSLVYGNPTEPPVIRIELDHLLDAENLRLAPHLADIVPFVEFLQHPKLQIGINRIPISSDDIVNSLLGIGGSRPDLSLFVHDPPVDPQHGTFGRIILDSAKQKVLVGWNGFNYPEAQWASSQKVISIQDCDNSQFVVMLSKGGNIDSALDKVASESVPAWVNIHLDNHVATFSHLNEVAPVGKWRAFSAMFSSADDILTGKASLSLDPSYSWGY